MIGNNGDYSRIPGDDQLPGVVLNDLPSAANDTGRWIFAGGVRSLRNHFVAVPVDERLHNFIIG